MTNLTVMTDYDENPKTRVLLVHRFGFSTVHAAIKIPMRWIDSRRNFTIHMCL